MDAYISVFTFIGVCRMEPFSSENLILIFECINISEGCFGGVNIASYANMNFTICIYNIISIEQALIDITRNSREKKIVICLHVT